MIWFNDYMEKETITKSTLPNYTIVGFGFGGGNQLVPLMHLGFHGSLPLGLAHDGLCISFFNWGFTWLYIEVNGGDLHGHEGNGSFGFKVFRWFGTDAFKCCLTSHLVCGWLQVLGSLESIMVERSSLVLV